MERRLGGNISRGRWVPTRSSMPADDAIVVWEGLDVSCWRVESVTLSPVTECLMARHSLSSLERVIARSRMYKADHASTHSISFLPHALSHQSVSCSRSLALLRPFLVCTPRINTLQFYSLVLLARICADYTSLGSICHRLQHHGHLRSRSNQRAHRTRPRNP